MIRRTLLSAILVTLTLSLYVSCNKSSSDGDSGGGNVSSLFKSAFPEEAAVSSPTAQKSAGQSSLQSLEDGVRIMADATDTADKKKEALDTVIDGTTSDSCKVNINLYTSGNANCYGPTLKMANHPDGTVTGDLPPGDLGIWTATEGTEACAAAQLNSRMKGVSSMMDAAFFSVASMMCAAKNAGQTLPEVGSSVDVSSSMSGKVTINSNSTTITTATLARESDTNGKPVYVSTIQGSYTESSHSKTFTIRMKHVPAGVQDETTFTGKVSIKLTDNQLDSGFAGNCSGSSGGGVDAASIIYEKTSSSNMKYYLKTANYCGSNGNPFVSSSNYSVDLTRTYSSNNGGWGNNANVLLADFDPSTGIGSYQYAWQAGRNDSHARVLNVKISSASSATAYFGFGPALSGTTGLGSIDRMICNWAGPGNNHTGVSKVQKQTLTRSSTTFTPSASYITYDPSNSCDGGGSFTYGISANNEVNASSTTSNLVNLTDLTSTITNVTAPSDVD